MIAKVLEEGIYELFETVPMETENGQFVDVLKSVGVYTKVQLENEIVSLQKQILDRETILGIINSI